MAHPRDILERVQKIITDEECRESGSNIIKEKIKKAIKLTNNNNLIKLIKNEQIRVLLDLFNTIYSTGIIPKEWILSTLVTFLKIANGRDCEDHRRVSLMFHILKIFLKVIHLKIFRKLE